jgi:uncharacterized protein
VPRLIVDLHVYAFPPTLTGHPLLGGLLPQGLRSELRRWLRPFSNSLHYAQTYVRYFPSAPRRALEQLAMLAPIPNLLVEASPEDLLEAMREAGVSHALVTAHPPLAENDFILQLCMHHPELLPCVYIPAGTPKPAEALRHLALKGARALKLHPSADGEDADSPRYKALLQCASELGLPVILHTGRFQIPYLLKCPEFGDAQRFVTWFEAFPSLRFVLAHMNYSQPQVALDIAEDHANVQVEISWQPVEIIEEAVRRLGAERVFFGTDWPLMGNNLSVGIRRIDACVADGVLDPAQAAQILGLNARKLLGIAEQQAPQVETKPEGGKDDRAC